MTLRKPGIALVALIVMGALSVVALKRQALAELRGQNAGLGQRLEQLRRLAAENQRMYRLIAELHPDRPDRLLDELARLRLEAERLRVHKEEWEALCAENRQLRSDLGDGVRPLLPKESWAY
jgi:hypothetical protein